MIGDLFLNFVVYLNLYWQYAIAVFVPGFYYIFIRIFTFPLITRKAHEFVLIVSPESVKIKKIAARLTPMFVHKKGLYWFDEACDDVGSLNRYNLYIEGMNQTIINQERKENKIHDTVKELDIPKQVVSHKILLPKDIKTHFQRHFMLIVNPKQQLLELRPAEHRQSLRVSFYHTLGVYIQQQVSEEKPVEGEGASGGGKLQLLQLNTQVVLRQIKHASSFRYFSSHYAYRLWKSVKRADRYWDVWLSGSTDPRIIIILISLIGMVAGGYVFMQLFMPKLGPMPI